MGGSSVSFPGVVAVSSFLLSSFLSAVKEPDAVMEIVGQASQKRRPKQGSKTEVPESQKLRP